MGGSKQPRSACCCSKTFLKAGWGNGWWWPSHRGRILFQCNSNYFLIDFWIVFITQEEKLVQHLLETFYVLQTQNSGNYLRKYGIFFSGFFWCMIICLNLFRSSVLLAHPIVLHWPIFLTFVSYFDTFQPLCMWLLSGRLPPSIL